MKFNWYTVTLAPDDAGVTRKTRTVAEKPDQAARAVCNFFGAPTSAVKAVELIANPHRKAALL